MSERHIALAIRERLAPNPQAGVECSASRCTETATVVDFGGSTPYCPQHGGDHAQPISDELVEVVVRVDSDDEFDVSGREFADWTLSGALQALGVAIVAERFEREDR